MSRRSLRHLRINAIGSEGIETDEHTGLLEKRYSRRASSSGSDTEKKSDIFYDSSEDERSATSSSRKSRSSSYNPLNDALEDKAVGKVRIKAIRRQDKRQHMYILTIAYLITGVLNIIAVITDLQPSEYWNTHEAVYMALGDPVYTDPAAITSYEDFFSWLKLIASNFFQDPDNVGPDKEDGYVFQNYIFVQRGILLLQWKRKEPEYPVKLCTGPRSTDCGFGAPAYYDYADPFEALLDSATNLIRERNFSVISEEDLDTRKPPIKDDQDTNPSFVDFFWLPVETDERVKNRIKDLSDSGWLNPNTSQVNIFILLYNPSLLATSRCVVTIEFSLGGLITTEAKVLSFSSQLGSGSGFSTNIISQLALHIVAFLCIVSLLIYEFIRTFRWARSHTQKGKLGIRSKWALAAVIVSIFVTLAIIIEYFVLFYQLQPVTTNISDKPDRNTTLTENLLEFLTVLKNFDQVYGVTESYKALNSLNLVLFGLRLFTLLHFFRSFRTINATLLRAFMPLVTFSAYVVVVLALFSCIATIQFGAYSSHFDTFTDTYELLFRFFALWDFDYESLKSYQINTVSFVIFYVAFTMVMVITMANMFLAIIYASFETTVFFEYSSGHGFLIWQTVQILIYSHRYIIWPKSILKRLAVAGIEQEILTYEEFSRAGIDPDSIYKIIEIYGEDKEDEPNNNGENLNGLDGNGVR